MAGRGRGRGRGLLTGAPLTPGGLANSPAKSTDLNKLSALVGKLNLDCSSKVVSEVADEALKVGLTENRGEDAVEILYKRCTSDWQVAETVVTVCKEMLQGELTDEKKKLRTQLLKVMQKDYNIRDALREDNLQHFLGSAAFLCQLFAKLKLPDGTPFLMLIDPVVDMLSILLDNKATNQEMECAACQLLAVGKPLKEHKPDKLNTLMWAIKNNIVNGKGSADTRIELVTVIEANASGWTMHVE